MQESTMIAIWILVLESCLIIKLEKTINKLLNFDKMKHKKIFFALVIPLLIAYSCNNSDVETENLTAAMKMEQSLLKMASENDSLVIHHSGILYHHHDSIYHHHDSIYTHEHIIYHHGDTIHHHSDGHHNESQHHQHDSIAISHHHIAH